MSTSFLRIQDMYNALLLNCQSSCVYLGKGKFPSIIYLARQGQNRAPSRPHLSIHQFHLLGIKRCHLLWEKMKI